MTPEEKLEIIDIALKLQSIHINKEILEKIVLTIDLVNKRKNKTNLSDIINIRNN